MVNTSNTNGMTHSRIYWQTQNVQEAADAVLAEAMAERLAHRLSPVANRSRSAGFGVIRCAWRRSTRPVTATDLRVVCWQGAGVCYRGGDAAANQRPW